MQLHALQHEKTLSISLRSCLACFRLSNNKNKALVQIFSFASNSQKRNSSHLYIVFKIQNIYIQPRYKRGSTQGTLRKQRGQTSIFSYSHSQDMMWILLYVVHDVDAWLLNKLSLEIMIHYFFCLKTTNFVQNLFYLSFLFRPVS